MQISWNEFKKRYPSKFELILNRVAQEKQLDRSDAIDVLDENYTFEIMGVGYIKVTNDDTGRYCVLPLWR
jgi:hypothetical protein